MGPFDPDKTLGKTPNTCEVEISNLVQPWFAVKRRLTPDQAGFDGFLALGCWTWLEDTRDGGTYSVEFGRSVWFDTIEEARGALEDAEFDLSVHQLVRLTINPDGGNYYLTEDVPWS